MSKKKKKKQKEFSYDFGMLNVETKSKKKLRKQFEDAIEDIEYAQIRLMEADKKANRKNRKKINKKEKEFYTDMGSIKCRKKMAKKWEKTGFMDTLINLLNQISPMVKTLAKLIGMLIISFLSIDAVKSMISPEMLKKIDTAFKIAMAV